MTDDFKNELIKFLQQELKIDIDQKSVYTGGFGDQPLYKDYKQVSITLRGAVLLEFDIN